MKPGPTLIALLWLGAACALLALCARMVPLPQAVFANAAWWALLAITFTLSTIDLLLSLARPRPTCTRSMPSILALGRTNKINITVTNGSRGRLSGRLVDHYPDSMESTDALCNFSLEEKGVLEWQYHVTPEHRGVFQFEETELQLFSPLRLWVIRQRLGTREQVRVYPDFLTLDNLQNASLEKSAERLGIHLQRRRGEGTEFLQLREFREKDQLRQVDWKASARFHKLISREYHDQTDRDIIFLLDCGKRMHGRDGKLSHFDHCLNAILLCAYFALRLGDRVGVCTFAGEQRWIEPVSHKSGINELLEQLYTLQTSDQSTDFHDAVQTLASRRSKRALVVIVSNVQSEDAADLSNALRVLGGRHRVLLANLREAALVERVQRPVTQFDDALEYAVAEDLLRGRERALELARGQHADIVDCLPRHLHRALSETYLVMKRSGSF